MNKQSNALYPNLVAPEDFRSGDVVKKIFGDIRVTPYLGVVLAIHPTTNTIDVRWPYGVGFENPQDLVRVNPWYTPPSVGLSGESYYTTWDAEKWNSDTAGENSTKGISSKSPLYATITSAHIPVVIDAAITNTVSNAQNVEPVVVNYDHDITHLKVAQRYAQRVFNVLLRAAVSPFNARLSQKDTYRFLYGRFGKVYAEPSIRQVVSFLYCTPHNYFEEDFDQVLKQAVIAALNADKKSLKSVFNLAIKNTEGKKKVKFNDLIDAAINEPHAKTVYRFIREAVERSGGNLDILPTPSARFAKVKKHGNRDYLISFKTSDERSDFASDPEFKDHFEQNCVVRFRGKTSISCSSLPDKDAASLEQLITQYGGVIDWTNAVEKAV